jgi:hypothetical protein
MSAVRSLSLALMVSLTLPFSAFPESAIPTGDVWPAPSDQRGPYVTAPMQALRVPADVVPSGDVWLIPHTAADTADPTLTVSPRNNDLGHAATVDPKTPD